jgi:RadC-like JAB domain-containing protein
VPFVQSQGPGQLDTSELTATPPPQALPAYQDDSGTGANGPKYSSSEFWSGIGRTTIPGQAITDIRAMRASGYNPLEAGEITDPETTIPEDMKPYADKYVGLYTKEQIAYRTFQLRQQQWDSTHGLQSKWSLPASLAAGLVDPVGVASMFVPGGAETRLGAAVHTALVGGAVTAVDEAISSQLAPSNFEFADSMRNVGAGTLVSGILGAVLHRAVPRADFQRMRAQLQEELNAAAPEPPRAPSGDSAANIAADLRAAVEAHGQGLATAAEQARATAATIDPAAAEARLKAAQDALGAVPRETTPEASEAAIAAQAAKFGEGTGVPERLAAHYGDKAPDVLAGRAAALAAAQRESQAAIEREVAAAQEDLARIQAAKDAQATLQAFHETQRAPSGYTPEGGTEPLPSGIRPGGEPGVRPELSAEQGALPAGGGQPGQPVPRRPLGGRAQPGENRGGGARQLQSRAKGRGASLGISKAPAVERVVYDRLTATKRATPEQAHSYAALIGDFYATQAQRLGLTADELFAKHPLNITGETRVHGFLQAEEPGIEVGERGMTPEEEKLFAGLRENQTGKPLTVAYRGGRNTGPLTAEHFKSENFGAATNRPSAGLGVFFTNRPAEAGRYGQVSTHHLDMQRPLHIRSEDLPGFNSTQEATAWARAQEGKGYDGLIIDASHMGGQTWYVPFKLEQVRHAGAGVVREPAGRGRGRIDTYTGDLFGAQLPAKQGEARATEAAGERGNLSAAGELPPGEYARHTEIVTDSQRELGTAKVTTPQEAAQAFSALGRGAKERFDALVTDKDGKPLAIVGSSVGTHDAASVFPAIVAAEAFRVEGAAHIWFGHNHPSGQPSLSIPDRQIAAKLNNIFEGSSIEPHGIHAIAGGAEESGRAWHYAEPGTTTEHGGVTSTLTGKISVPVIERVFSKHGALGPPISGPNDAVIAARKIAGDRSGVILADSRNTPVGFVELTGEQMREFRGTPMMDAMHRALSVSNANKAFIVTNGEIGTLTKAQRATTLDTGRLDMDSIENLARFLHSADVTVHDVINTKSGEGWSERKLGDMRQLGDRFAQSERGGYDPASHTIALSETANASTFLHESGHHFLDLMTQLADHPDAPLSMREDVQSLMDWFKVKDTTAWRELGLEGQRAYHEKFAQGFEQYLKDGVAPNSRLQGLFDQFREWLGQIYKGLVNQFGDRLPQDVREVMDRLLATDAETKAATAERVANAPTPTLARVAGDAPLRDELRHMAARETGWAETGGKMIRKEVLAGGRGNEFDISRTSWIPNSEWWPGRPGGYNAEETQRIVDKALAGEKLGPKQGQLLEYMVEVADQRVATEPFLPHPSELDEHALEHSSANAFEAAMVARLAAIDETAVENLARHFEDDDAGFMVKVKELLDAHDEDAKLSRSVPQNLEPLGFTPDRGTAGRSAEPTGARGEAPTRTAAAEGERPATRSAGAPRDLFGEAPTGAQALADEQRRRDLKRNSGQESLETGNPNDLFSQARHQADLTDMLKKLPPEIAAPFHARIEALEDPTHAPIYSAPEGGQSMGASSTEDRAQGLKDYSLARGGRTLGKALGWFAPGSRALSSPSLAMRKTMARLIETPEMLEMNVPTPERPFGLPTPIAVQTILKKWEGNWAKAFAARDAIFRDYRKRPQSEVEGPKMGKHEFNESVSMAMRRGDAWFIPEIEKAAKATRAIVFDPLKIEAQKLGLLPKEDPTLGGTAESYLMRQYDRAKIQKDQLGWHQTLVDGFVKQGVEASEAADIAHAVTRNILGTELGLLDTDKAAFHAVPQSGRLKERTLKLPDLDLEKYLTNDIDTLSHSYLKSLAPQVEMMKMFRDDLRNDGLDEKAQGFRVATPDLQATPSNAERRNLTGPAKDITDEYAILKQRALAAGDNAQANALDKRLRADLRDLAAVRDRLYGIYGAPGDSASWLQRSGRVIRSVNALRLLGTATWSHVPDLANIVMRRGLPRTMAIAAKLSSSLEALNLNREQLHRVGTVMDMIHNTTAAALGEFGVESSYALQKTLNRATRAFTIATLETPWIATCKALAGAAAHDEILEAAGRARRFSKRVGPDLSANERTRFNSMGLDQQMLERIDDQFGQYGRNVNGVRFGMTDAWHDQGAAQALDGATTNAAEASTLSPGAGDTPLWTSSEVGKAIFQFKTFGAVAIRRVTIPLAQGLAHADIRSAQGLATLIAAGALTYTMKQLLSGQPMEKDPGRYALEVLDKSNLLGWTGEYFYPSLWQFGMGNFSRWGDRQTWETLGGPVAGTAVDAWDLRLPAKLIGTMRGQGPQIKRSDIHRIRRMLPGNQVWYLRRAVNALEGHVGDAMGLPPADVPGSTE